MSAPTPPSPVTYPLPPPTPGGYCDMGPDRDRRDAEAILLTVRAALLVIETAPRAAKRQMREAVTHFWQIPRLMVSRMVGGRCPESVLWTKEAAAPLLAKSDAMSSATSSPPKSEASGLVLEHLVPQNLFVTELIDAVGSPLGLSLDQMVAMLRDHHRDAVLIVVTKDEDKSINKQGWRSTTPDRANPMERYSRSGIDVGALAQISPGVLPPAGAPTPSEVTAATPTDDEMDSDA